MNNQFAMFETLKDSFRSCKENWRDYGLNTFIVIITYLFSILLFVSIARFNLDGITVDTYKSVDIFRPLITVFLMMIPVTLVFSVIMTVYIKIADDIYEKRNLTLKEQYSFVLKKFGRVILASFMMMIPAFIIQIFMILVMIGPGFELLQVLLSLVFMCIGLLFLMVIPSIIIEDLKPFDAFKRSVGMMLPNIFRIIGFVIVLYFIMLMIALVFALGFGLIMMIPILNIVVIVAFYVANFVALFILAPFPYVFMTLLFKSVSYTPYDNDERHTLSNEEDTLDSLFEDRVYE